MHKISRITTQKKNNHRFNIFLQHAEKDKYAFSVDADILVTYGLRKGLELSDEALQNLQQQDNIQKGYSMALQFLGYRMRTKKEVHDYLLEKEINDDQIQEIFFRLIEEKLLDDQAFAHAFMRDRMAFSNKGPLILKQELIKKGVAKDITASAIQLFTHDKQFEKASKLAGKRLQRSTSKSFTQQLQQLHAHLLQKGFANDVAKDVIADFKDEKNTDDEWEALQKQGEKLWQKHAKKQNGYHLRQKVKEGLYRKGFDLDVIDKFLDSQREDDA